MSATLLSEPLTAVEGRDDYLAVERAMDYIARNLPDQPELGEIAAHVGLSEFHFQRVFTRWAGASPKKFLQYLTLGEARRRLGATESVLDATLATGLSGPGRLHDLCVRWTALSPGEIRARGAGVSGAWGFAATPFGEAAVLVTGRGISGLGFVQDGDRAEAVATITAGLEHAELREDRDTAALAVRRIFEPRTGDAPVDIWARGTPFQLQVWRALVALPPGAVVSYSGLARGLGRRGGLAARAVGSAAGANRVAYLIPCHRVIRATGEPGEYRWGAARKLAILGREAAAGPL